MRVFCYPIMTTHGVSLTRMGHPHDPHGHSHHNSVWLSHTNVNGVNFWADRVGAPKREPPQGRVVKAEIVRGGYAEGEDAASMLMVNHWLRDHDKEIQLIERRRMEVRVMQGAGDWFLLIDSEFTAPKGRTSTIGSSFFGMIAVRMAKSIGVHDGGGRILNSEGQRNEKEVFRRPAKWVDYSGRITNAVEGLAGITLMNHPKNPHHPTAFHVRDDGWMGAALVPDKLDSQPAMPTITVTDTQPLCLRYALWVHDGLPDAQRITQRYEQFISLPIADLHPQPK
jgi:hypothetical protein